jgi:hypothetical protein
VYSGRGSSYGWSVVNMMSLGMTPPLNLVSYLTVTVFVQVVMLYGNS